MTSGDEFKIKKHNRGYLLYANGRDIKIRESFPIETRGVYYLESTTSGNLFEFNLVPVVNRRFSNQRGSNQAIIPNL